MSCAGAAKSKWCGNVDLASSRCRFELALKYFRHWTKEYYFDLCIIIGVPLSSGGNMILKWSNKIYAYKRNQNPHFSFNSTFIIALQKSILQIWKRTSLYASHTSASITSIFLRFLVALTCPLNMAAIPNINDQTLVVLTYGASSTTSILESYEDKISMTLIYVWYGIVIALTTFLIFGACLMCHEEQHRKRPETPYPYRSILKISRLDNKYREKVPSSKHVHWSLPEDFKDR